MHKNTYNRVSLKINLFEIDVDDAPFT